MTGLLSVSAAMSPRIIRLINTYIVKIKAHMARTHRSGTGESCGRSVSPLVSAIVQASARQDGEKAGIRNHGQPMEKDSFFRHAQQSQQQEIPPLPVRVYGVVAKIPTAIRTRNTQTMRRLRPAFAFSMRRARFASTSPVFVSPYPFS